MRGNGNVFRPGDSIAIEIRVDEAILRPICIQKSTPPCQSETRGCQCSGLFLLLKKVKQRPCRCSPHGIIRVVKGFLHEGDKFTIPNMPE